MKYDTTMCHSCNSFAQVQSLRNEPIASIQTVSRAIGRSACAEGWPEDREGDSALQGTFRQNVSFLTHGRVSEDGGVHALWQNVEIASFGSRGRRGYAGCGVGSFHGLPSALGRGDRAARRRGRKGLVGRLGTLASEPPLGLAPVGLLGAAPLLGPAPMGLGPAGLWLLRTGPALLDRRMGLPSLRLARLGRRAGG